MATTTLPACAGRQAKPTIVARPAESRTTPVSRNRNAPPAILNGESITWSDMTPLLAEAAGGQILEEIVLDRMLEAEAERRNVVITPEEIQREERLLLDSLVQSDVAANDAEGRTLLNNLRERRGLGEKRYNALLRRSALLRALSQDRVVMDDDLIYQAFELLHGPRYDVRLIVVGSAPSLTAASTQLREGRPFNEVAARFSTHESAARGGLVENVSPADPSLPSAIRESIRDLDEGETSDAINLTNGFAIVQVESFTPGDGMRFDIVRPEVEAQARLTQERLAMTSLANELLQLANVTVYDPDLATAWRIRTR
jgi:parvulin-like peptidyl-prolyl isomerase